jgi:hypothetical protein
MASRHSPPPPPPPPYGQKPKAEKSSIWNLLGTSLFVFVLLALPVLRADDDVEWGLFEFLGYGIVYRSPFPKPMWGGAYSKDVQVDLDSDQPMRIGEVSVEYSVINQFLRAYTRGKFAPDLNEVTVNLERIDNPTGFPFGKLIGEIDIGGISMSPAEAAGCGDIFRFSETQIREMGLSPVPTRATEKVSVEGNSITMVQTFESPGIATTRVTRKGVLEDVGGELFNDYGLPGDIVWKEHSWEVDDKGFVKARNAYCAAKMGVSEAQFLGYHVAAVERVLLASGMRANSDMRQLYIDYAAHGGSFSVEGKYSRDDVVEGSFADLDWGVQFSSFSGTIKRDQAQGAFAFEQTSAQAFDEADEELTTYQILQKEGYAVAPIADDAVTAGLAELAPSNEVLETSVVTAAADPNMTSRVVLVPLEENEILSSFSQLGRYVGRRVRVERRMRDPLVGKVLSMTANGARMRVYKGSGYVDLEVPSSDFVRAIVFPVR